MLFNKEPTAILNAIAELIRQVIPLLILFGFIHWTGEQVAQTMVVVSLVITLLATILTRTQTVPVEKVNSQIATALIMPSTATIADVVKTEEEGRK